jgi:hypothetical protein
VQTRGSSHSSSSQSESCDEGLPQTSTVLVDEALRAWHPRDAREGSPREGKKFVPTAIAPPNPPTSFGREHRGVGQLRRAIQSEAGEPRRHWQVHALTLESSALSLSRRHCVQDCSRFFSSVPKAASTKILYLRTTRLNPGTACAENESTHSQIPGSVHPEGAAGSESAYRRPKHAEKWDHLDAFSPVRVDEEKGLGKRVHLRRTPPQQARQNKHALRDGAPRASGST